ncbi:unnamed protein product [Camellia sinensis]
MPVSPGQPSSISDDEGVTLVGSGQDAANLINQKEIHWGIKERLIQITCHREARVKIEGFCAVIIGSDALIHA